MNNLETLYTAIDNFKKLGVEIDPKTIESTLNVEENIIKKDMIPAMGEAIVPIISQIQRELVLVLEYVPDKPIEIKMTRKRSFKLSEDEERIVTERKEFQKETKYTIPTHSKSPKTNLRIIFPNGNVIENYYAMDTLIQFIERVGVEKVAELKLRANKGFLVSKVKSNYRQSRLSKGYLLMTQTNTKTKKSQILKIAKKLNISVEVQIIHPKGSKDN